MKVVNLKKPPKDSRFYFLLYSLQSHMKIHEKESIHPIALFLNISSLEVQTKSPFILICNEKKNQIFDMLLQCKLDKNFNLTWEESRSLPVLSSMIAKICFKMLMKSFVNHFQWTEFSIRHWQTLILFYNHFLKLSSKRWTYSQHWSGFE